MKKIKKFLLGRATIVALGIAIQLFWMFLFIQKYSVRYSFIGTLIDIVAIFIALVIVNKNSNPSYKLIWMVVILAIPLVGVLLYFAFGRSKLTRPTRKRMEAINRQMEQEFPQNENVLEKIRVMDKEVYRQSKYVRDWAKFPVYENTTTK